MSRKINLTKEFLYKEYIQNNHTIYQIAEETGYTGAGIWYRLGKYGISTRKKYYTEILTKEFLYQEYIVNKKTMLQISKEVNCARSTMCKFLTKNNIKPRTISETNKLRDDKYSYILTKEFLIKEYITNKKSTIQIANEIGCSYETIFRYLKKYKIKIRNLIELMTGKNNWNWHGGISPLYHTIRCLKEYKNWRNQIFKRDNYTCQYCGDNKGHNLNAHHIKHFQQLLNVFLVEYDQFSPIEDKETLVSLAIKYKPFWGITNGITLCKDCHKKEHSKIKENKICQT